jgi:hypothetical protein
MRRVGVFYQGYGSYAVAMFKCQSKSLKLEHQEFFVIQDQTAFRKVTSRSYLVHE